MAKSDFTKWDIGKFSYNKTEGLLHDFLLNNTSNFEIKNVVKEYVPTWYKEKYRYDFFIELVDGKKIIIECDGEWHYTKIAHFYRNKTLEQQHEIDIFKMQIAWANSVSIIRVHQEEVWNDTINWEKELTDAINEIKNENDVTLKLLGCLKDRVDWWDLK